MRKWHGLPHPSFVAGASAVVCVLAAIVQLRTLVTLYALFEPLPIPLLSRVPFAGLMLGVAWLVAGIGLTFERAWARVAFRTLVVGELAATIAFTAVGGPIAASTRTILRELLLAYLAWSLTFHDEWRQPMSLQRALHWFRGRSIQIWHQVRYLMGSSYLPWRYPPAELSAAERSESGLLTATLKVNLPPFSAPSWVLAGNIVVESGTLRICDPPALLGGNEFSVDVHEVPPGAHPLQLQITRFGGWIGRRIVRAKVIWAHGDPDDSEYAGDVGVDFGMMSICDVGRLRRFHPAGTPTEDTWPAVDSLLPDDRSWNFYSAPSGEPLIATFRSGMGDGSYSVFRLQSSGTTVGILIELMSEEPKKMWLGHLAGWPERRRRRRQAPAK